MEEKFLILNLTDVPVMQSVGELLRGWAMGTQTLPATPEATKQALADAGLIFVDSVERVVLHQSTSEELHVVLPRARSLEIARQEIEDNPLGYGIQKHYTDFVHDRDENGGLFDDPGEVLTFYDFRLADYCLQHCM